MSRYKGRSGACGELGPFFIGSRDCCFSTSEKRSYRSYVLSKCGEGKAGPTSSRPRTPSCMRGPGLLRRFNATLSAKGYVWFWPKIAAALTSKHHWLVINCDSCGTVVDLDLSVKPRDPGGDGSEERCSRAIIVQNQGQVSLERTWQVAR